MPLLNIPVTFSVANNILRVIIYLSVSSTKQWTGIDSTFFCVLALGFSILFKMSRLTTQEYKEKTATVYGSKPFTFIKFSYQPFDLGTIIVPFYR